MKTVKIGGLRVVNPDIIYIKSDSNYSVIYYYVGNTSVKVLMAYTLSHYATQFPDMVRIHRSCLVNPAHVVAWEGHRLTGVVLKMRNGDEVTVSKHRVMRLILGKATLADILLACRNYRNESNTRVINLK